MANIEHEMLRSLLRCLGGAGPDGSAAGPALGLFYDDHLMLVARAHRLSALLGTLRAEDIPPGLA